MPLAARKQEELNIVDALWLQRLHENPLIPLELCLAWNLRHVYSTHTSNLLAVILQHLKLTYSSIFWCQPEILKISYNKMFTPQLCLLKLLKNDFGATENLCRSIALIKCYKSYPVKPNHKTFTIKSLKSRSHYLLCLHWTWL